MITCGICGLKYQVFAEYMDHECPNKYLIEDDLTEETEEENEKEN